jgi:dolichyl-phosphate-mannose--protein O-mannosyl transferase
MINIVYITLGASAYLILWCFVQSPESRTRRIYLLAMSLVLGLYVAAKAAISEVGVLLTLAVVAFTFIRERRTRISAGRSSSVARRIIGACGLVSAIALLVYLMVFLPYYWFGWWSGIGDFVAYHQRVLHYNSGLPTDFPDASPFWSWPLLLHPYPYFQKDLLNDTVEVIWCGGNPLLWWAILPAILISFVHAYTQKNLSWIFLSAGYLAYLAMWIPLRRYIFIYSYMPAQYLGLLALAGALDQCWMGSARCWEQLILLAPVVICLILAFGVQWGVMIACSIAIVYLFLAHSPEGRDAKFVCLTFASATLWFCVYFFPLWTCIPLSQAGYTARMWLRGPGLVNWQ